MFIPLMPLNAVLFPGMPMPLGIFEDRYRRMVEECLDAEEPFGVVLIRSGPEVGGIAQPHDIGTTAQVVHVSDSDEGLGVIVVGRERFRVNELDVDGEVLRAEVSILESEPADERVSLELCSELSQMLAEHIQTILKLLGMPAEKPAVPNEPERLSFMIAAHLTASLQERQRLLELSSAAERLMHERELLRKETEQYRVLYASFRRAEETQSPYGSSDVFFSRN